MDTGKSVVGQVELSIDWADSNEACQKNAVKREPCETDHFRYVSQETEFVDHDHYATHTHSCPEMREEKFETDNLNPENFDHSKFSVNCKIGCKKDLTQDFKIDIVKNEPCEVDNFNKCGRYFNSYSDEINHLDHNNSYATHSDQELREEKRDIKNLNPENLEYSECSKELSSTCNAAQFKNENDTDIFPENIKSTNHEFETQNESIYNIHGEDMTHDIKPTSGLITGYGIGQLGVQDEATFADEVIKEQMIRSGEKKYHCKICTKSFYTSCKLKVHGRIHTGEKPFFCKICLKSFTQKGSLKCHERQHTGEKPFHCNICSKSFTQSSHLKSHERIHTNKKLFPCKICSKTFIQSSILKTHERCHTGEKPFQCKVCLKAFIQSRYLKAHEKRLTLEKNHSFVKSAQKSSV